MSSAPLPAEIRPRPLRREEYDHLIALGCFEQERLELLRGVIVRMSPQNDPHSFAVEQLTELLVTALVGRARVRVQLPMAASDDSEPEPDLLVAPRDESPGRHPTRAVLIIEVADASLRLDLGTKAALYAECGVPEYWVVNLRQRCVEVLAAPSQGRYGSRRRAAISEILRVDAFPDVEVPVSRLFGPE